MPTQLAPDKQRATRDRRPEEGNGGAARLGDRPFSRTDLGPISESDLTVRDLLNPEHLVGIGPTLPGTPFTDSVLGAAADLGR
jgi:hypothetical protein